MIEERTLNPADLKKMKVLIVDPNAFMRGVMAELAAPPDGHQRGAPPPAP